MGRWRYKFRAFRLSEMMPNSWLNKLRDMRIRRSKGSRKVQNSMKTGRSFENQKPSREAPQKQAYDPNRPSNYIPSGNRVEKLPYSPTPFDKPRKTKPNIRKNPLSTQNKHISSSLSSINNSKEQSSSFPSSEPAHETPLHHLDGVLFSTDFNLSIILPPIVTKPIKKATHEPDIAAGQPIHVRRLYTSQTPRNKMRLNSPRLAKKRLRQKNGLADSFVVVKFSSDPESDFRESMLEMIFQNNLWASKDLEELLSCYLYFNSDEYHDLIVQAFKQIWFDLTVMNLQYK
ncbi:transcription repressor OFP1-like [Phalaenopsis equestris]|uniref:transcription repressor OFP1-like n=1 Tax=Phalaenopsis equestris TaxID=78828 RepID=UPI0009E367CB|nr:transcription repressor OFP1-like [Phalaenopsis equestris]XP_020594758.1 transcription repressor OFP1-like [Phalaenopsis equestris]